VNLSLDGTWELAAGEEPDWDAAVPVAVPGLWEAQGLLERDGVAWYRRHFELGNGADGCWTLRFGAVMDTAEVWLNGIRLGAHGSAFTPFELDAARALRHGSNELVVKVTDPPRDSPGHLRSAHGKQGWANHVFPSPPSLYLTYGGIWQPVSLRRHGPLAITDVFADGDPGRLSVTVTLVNRGDRALGGQVTVTAAGRRADADVPPLAPGRRRVVTLGLGRPDAERWTPERPVLHVASVSVSAGGRPSDSRSVRFGLRSIRMRGERLLLNDEPYRMRSALVQGFWPRGLYAEDGRDAIVAEVRAAKAMGLNTLRLHIKAFDPVYLDVCDELGMLLHCDIPVAEPVDHDQLGADTELARACVAAATEQVMRDRNHPSVILWSAMNELGLERMESRAGPGYEAFARTVTAAVMAADPTRPVIENDWIDPDPERVFASPILTAHWYGRLSSDWLERLDDEAGRWAGTRRPLLVTEFGDWGLPSMPPRDDPPFWWQGPYYASALAATPWPGDLAAFTTGTQRYQGLADRLQGEVLRRHDHIGGWCVTELTDVPHELNGLLDLERNPKPPAVAELARLDQAVLPMLRLTGFAVVAGERVTAGLSVANDGPALSGVTVEARFGDRVEHLAGPLELPAHRVTDLGEVRVPAADRIGPVELELRVTAGDPGGEPVAANRYPFTVVPEPRVAGPVELVGEGPTRAALDRVGAAAGPGPGAGPGAVLVVAERSLDEATGRVARERLEAGGTVLILAQEPEAAGHYPVPAELFAVDTGWGSSVFNFTTGEGRLASLPPATVLTVEAAPVFPAAWLTRLGGEGWPPVVAVASFKPVPDAVSGTVVGALDAHGGRLVACQFRLAERAAAGDVTARALLADLLAWAAAGAP
jgi:hypothetical protein